MNNQIKFQRTIDKKIVESFKKERIVLIFGARQIGKTTACLAYFNSVKEEKKLISGEDNYIKEELGKCTEQSIKNIFGAATFIFIDEAQNIPNIGSVLKLIYDMMPNIKVLATGSSAFGLASMTNESLAGRKESISAYALTYSEMKINNIFNYDKNLIDQTLIFGSYPKVLLEADIERKKVILDELSESYLYKDVLNFQGIRKSLVIAKLAQLLGFQIGQEVSLNELARQLGISNETVNKYINILEKSFIIFALSSYSKNKRSEISRNKKYYFWDQGVRNSIVNTFQDLEARNDIGALWESYIISEVIKKSKLNNEFKNFYFWRNYSGQEIDLIVEKDSQINGYEIKYSKDNMGNKNSFREMYPECKLEVINRDNFNKILT